MFNNIDFIENDFLILPPVLSLVDVLNQIPEAPVSRYILTMEKNQITNVYYTCTLLMKIAKCSDKTLKLENLVDSEKFIVIEKQVVETNLKMLERSLINVVIDENNYPIGIINNFQSPVDIHEKLYLCKKFVDAFEEEILITDKDGYVRYLNPKAEKVCGVKSEEVLNKHVTYLEKEKIISSNLTMRVLRAKEKVNALQRLRNGSVILATAVPVFDEEMNINYIISTSKNVEEINKLNEKIAIKDNELKHKEQEIEKLKEQIFIKDKFIYESKEMDSIKKTIIKIAPTDASVLIQGESGAGKEVVTKLIHDLSHRSEHPFIKINCGMIPENLLDSELFGYEGGAFTGATREGKVGKFELAQNGTLFLDEIGEMPLALQVKLLEFLQDREIVRVGGTKRIKINTRIIAATNRDLKDMVKKNKFRLDLYYRLNVIPIKIPPLRERKEDIIPLTKFFLDELNNQYFTSKILSPEVIRAFLNYEWPGNVRELMNVMERLILLSNSETVDIETLPTALTGEIDPLGRVVCYGLLPLKEAKRDLEFQLVTRAYKEFKSTYKAAEALDIHQSTVVKILQKYK